MDREEKDEKGTFQRPASSPYFLVTSSAEEEEDGDGRSISPVFCLRAWTLKDLELNLRGGLGKLKWNLKFGWVKEKLEKDEKAIREEAVAIIRKSKVGISRHRLWIESLGLERKQGSHKINREREIYVKHYKPDICFLA